MSTTTTTTATTTATTTVTKPWEWQLPAGRALRLAPAPAPRWLQVGQGLVWLTATSASGDHNPDRWLVTGERQWLPAGTDWVVESRGDARYVLLEAPLAVRPRSATVTRRSLLSKCGFATLLNPRGGRTTYVVGLGALSRLTSMVQRLSLARAPQVCV